MFARSSYSLYNFFTLCQNPYTLSLNTTTVFSLLFTPHLTFPPSISPTTFLSYTHATYTHAHTRASVYFFRSLLRRLWNSPIILSPYIRSQIPVHHFLHLSSANIRGNFDPIRNVFISTLDDKINLWDPTSYRMYYIVCVNFRGYAWIADAVHDGINKR